MTRIGEYILRSIDAGTFGLDGGAMFGVIPKPLWERKIPADNRNRIRLAMRCLLVEGRDRLILIDNGIGTKFDEKFGDIYDVDTNSSSLERSLRSAGFGLDDVTDVIAGDAGVAFFLLYASRTLQRPRDLELALAIGRSLIARADRAGPDANLDWPMSPGYARRMPWFALTPPWRTIGSLISFPVHTLLKKFLAMARHKPMMMSSCLCPVCCL